MALFKILRGSKNNLPTTITDGQVYFTPEDKKLYIDVACQIGETNFNKRIRIAGGGSALIKEFTLRPSGEPEGWSGDKIYYPHNLDDATNDNYQLNIELNEELIENNYFEIASTAAKANIKVEIDGANFKFICQGETPEASIPVIVYVWEKESD